MVKLKNKSPKDFANYIKDKKVFIFGAGQSIRNCNKLYLGEKKVEYVIDNNEDLRGESIVVNGYESRIINIYEFVNIVKIQNKEEIIVLITSTFFGTEMLEQLDKIIELDGIECYMVAIMCETPDNSNFSYTFGENKIPRIFHYMWLGTRELPDEYKRYIETWHKYNPDYEIKIWNEKNYDINKNNYMLQAYEKKEWGFVPDYARLDIIYNYGGIYLDVDVEIIKKFDDLLNDEAFFGFVGNQIALGLGFGASKNNLFIKKLRDYYDEISFVRQDGSLDRRPCHYYQHPVFLEKGFEIKNVYQKIDDIVVYPSEVLAPIGPSNCIDNFTSNTHSIHHYARSWESERERENVDKLKKLYNKRVRDEEKYYE